jgi:uncharacterized protein (DUF885 family)
MEGNVGATHDAVLADGPLPLDVLETRINAWIGSQKTGGPSAK